MRRTEVGGEKYFAPIDTVRKTREALGFDKATPAASGFSSANTGEICTCAAGWGLA